MAFVVEPGDGTEPLANSYVSVTEFATYWTDRGYDYTTFETPKIQRSLIVATQYIDLENGRWFKGYPLEEDQPLAFPRSSLTINRNGACVEIEGIPIELKTATYEYARRVLTSTTFQLQPDPADTDESGSIVIKKFEKIGPIETDTTYLEGSASQVKHYPAADKHLIPLLRSWGSGSIRN